MRLAAMLLFIGLAGGCQGCVTGEEPPDAGIEGAVVRVDKAGDGDGTLSSAPAGIECDTACTSASFGFSVDVTAVTLTAVPARDALFERWSCAGTKDGVQLNNVEESSANVVAFEDAAPLGIDVACTASFRKTTTLLVVFAGQGRGRVRGTLEDLNGNKRIDCPPDCDSGYFVEEVETLHAQADVGSAFAGWAFCATGTDDVSLTMDAARNCEARFDLE